MAVVVLTETAIIGKALWLDVPDSSQPFPTIKTVDKVSRRWFRDIGMGIQKTVFGGSSAQNH
jgi:hypothetical protein